MTVIRHVKYSLNSVILPGEIKHIEEDDVKHRIILAIAGLAVLAGCGSPADKGGIPIEPKWKGAPYRIAFDAKPADPKAKPAAGINLPAIKYTANPDALENRAVLVLRFDVPAKGDQPAVTHRMVGAPVDVKGAEGALPADYMERASKGLTDYLAAYCVGGKVKLSVALARSSIKPQSGDAEIDGKRLSDWLPYEASLNKKLHGKC